ncbi:MAG: hypothetical protein ACR2K4_08330 [Candidatus Limnocylindria bacterium]
MIAVAEIGAPALGQLRDAQHFVGLRLLHAPHEPGVEARVVG